MKSIFLGNLIDRKKIIIFLVIDIMLEIAICYTFLGKYILFDLFFFIILLYVTISFCINENWIFTENHVEITYRNSFYTSFLLFFGFIIKNNHDKIYKKISYSDILLVSIMYKAVKSNGPLNTLGDNFYIQIKERSGDIHTFDLRYVYNNKNKILEIIKLLKNHDVHIKDEDNVIDLILNDVNLYDYFRKT